MLVLAVLWLRGGSGPKHRTKSFLTVLGLPEGAAGQSMWVLGCLHTGSSIVTVQID